MQIDWMVITYLVVGFFALVGFFRGWWKEAITTFVLIFLLILLQRPDWAITIVNFINWVIATVWQFITGLLNLPTTGPLQLDPTNAGTWILILLLSLGLSGLIARITLPGATNRVPGVYYTAGFIGRLLGLLLGALNGFLVLNLAREYLDGRALPGGTPPETEVAISGTSAFGPASTSLSIQAVNLPSFSILDSHLPWLAIGLGLLIFLAAITNRVKVLRSKAGSKIVYVSPYGYQQLPVYPKPKREEIGRV
jgi:hypothetical protein